MPSNVAVVVDVLLLITYQS